jgi:hypothetical protein
MTIKKAVPKLGISLEFSVVGHKAAEELAFAASLNDLSEVFNRRRAEAVGKFLKALACCEEGEVYDASQLFFCSLKAGDVWFDLARHQTEAGLQICVREREVLGAADGAWVNVGADVVDSLFPVTTDKSQRGALESLPPLIEALGLAVARNYCVLGYCDEAHRLVRRLLFVSRQSIHLRATESAIGLLLKGDPVPDHLKKFVAEDVNALADRFCPVPFARADVHEDGTVKVCCSHWLPTPIGNVFKGTTESILNSDTAKAIRKSVVDGSFKYCSHTDCEPIINNKLPFKKDYFDRGFNDDYYRVDEQILSDAFLLKRFEIPNISYLIFCLDRTCNLSCPSCRTDLIMVKGSERDRLYDVTDRVVLPMLKDAKRVMVNPAGEAFVSRPSRRLMESLAEPGYENLVIDIITNGTVCDRREWDKYAHLNRRMHIVRVSVDGVSKKVIEKLRRGADYDVLMANLKNLKHMRDAGDFKHFFLSFTYQRENLYEMEDFVELGHSLNASTVIFERLQNLGAFTPEEYYERAVHLIDHPLHQDFLRIASRVKRMPTVYIDFDPPPEQIGIERLEATAQ